MSRFIKLNLVGYRGGTTVEVRADAAHVVWEYGKGDEPGAWVRVKGQEGGYEVKETPNEMRKIIAAAKEGEST